MPWTYVPGDVLMIDISAAAVAAPEPLAIVIVQHYDPRSLTRSRTLLRQFVPPFLLTTNCRGRNFVPLDMSREDAHIKGVVVSHPP